MSEKHTLTIQSSLVAQVVVILLKAKMFMIRFPWCSRRCVRVSSRAARKVCSRVSQTSSKRQAAKTNKIMEK